MFQVQFAYAQVISQITGSRAMSVLKQTIQFILQQQSSLLLNYLEEYVSNQSSLFYSQQQQNVVFRHFNQYINTIINYSFCHDIVPVYLDAHKMVFMTDKLNEALAAKKLMQFIQTFKTQVIKFQPRSVTKLLLFLDGNNYFGITVNNTVI